MNSLDNGLIISYQDECYLCVRPYINCTRTHTHTHYTPYTYMSITDIVHEYGVYV